MVLQILWHACRLEYTDKYPNVSISSQRFFFSSLKPGGGGDDCTHHPPTLNRGGMHTPHPPPLSTPLHGRRNDFETGGGGIRHIFFSSDFQFPRHLQYGSAPPPGHVGHAQHSWKSDGGPLAHMPGGGGGGKFHIEGGGDVPLDSLGHRVWFCGHQY